MCINSASYVYYKYIICNTYFDDIKIYKLRKKSSQDIDLSAFNDNLFLVKFTFITTCVCTSYPAAAIQNALKLTFRNLPNFFSYGSYPVLYPGKIY